MIDAQKKLVMPGNNDSLKKICYFLLCFPVQKN